MRRPWAAALTLLAIRVTAAAAQPILPPPTVALDPALKPSRKSIPGRRGEGPPRPLAAVAGQRGKSGDFVANEILVFTNDVLVARRVAARWKGRVVASADFRRDGRGTIPTTHLIRVDSRLANPATLPRDLQAANRGRTDRLRVSSREGLLTLAVAASESAKGVMAGLNWVLRPGSIRNRSVQEGAGPFVGPDLVTFTNDPFHWPYLDIGSNQDIGVAEAWRALVAADKVRNKVDVLIVDSGFDPNPDFPPHTVLPPGTAGQPGPGTCDDTPCPFHGTDVVLGGFAVPDNMSFGAAGPGGPVANLTLVSTPSLDLFEILDFLQDLISSLIRGPRIISISGNSHVPASVCLGVCPALDLINVGFRAFNILTIALAGNDGGTDEDDVDREDCIGFACWEAGAEIPCEVQGVLCVGGLEWDSKWRHASSSYGSHSNDPTDRATVRMFAPFDVWVFNTHNTPATSIVSGTSESAPFVAGVAALVMAANPNLSADEVDGVLMSTAHSSPDPTVPRYVNAFEAVKSALGGSVPPTVTLVSPSTPLRRPQDRMIEFEARAVSGDRQNISSGITWQSDLPSDNPLPGRTHWIANDGAHPSFTLWPGTRNITASVTDHGWTDSAAVALTVTEVPVTVEIASPSAQSNRFFPGDNMVLIGRSHSLGGLSLHDSDVHWFLDNTTGVAIADGHGPTYVGVNTLCPAPPCRRTLLFTGSNGRTSATATREVFVDPTPTGPPPTVTIVSPAGNATVPGQFVSCVPPPTVPNVPRLPVFRADLTLQGSAVDQSGVAIPDADLTWRKYRANGPVIGTGGTLAAGVMETGFGGPGQPIRLQIFLVARDSQRATGSASVSISISTTPASCP